MKTSGIVFALAIASASMRRVGPRLERHEVGDGAHAGAHGHGGVHRVAPGGALGRVAPERDQLGEERQHLRAHRLAGGGRDVARLHGLAARAKPVDEGVRVEQAPVGPAGIVAGGKQRLGGPVLVAGHEEVRAGARLRPRLPQREGAALAADHLQDAVQVARDEAVGVGQGNEQGLGVQVGDARLALGVRGLAREAFLLRVQVEQVDLAPGALGDRRVRAVARVQQPRQALHRAIRDEGHLLLRAEGEELARLLQQERLVAVAELGGELAGEGERLARLGRQRQQRLAVHRVELVEHDLGHGPVGLVQLQPVVELDLGAVDRAEVGEDLPSRLGALAEGKRFHPGPGLLRAQVQVPGRGDAFGGDAKIEGHCCVNL